MGSRRRVAHDDSTRRPVRRSCTARGPRSAGRSARRARRRARYAASGGCVRLADVRGPVAAPMPSVVSRRCRLAARAVEDRPLHRRLVGPAPTAIGVPHRTHGRRSRPCTRPGGRPLATDCCSCRRATASRRDGSAIRVGRRPGPEALGEQRLGREDGADPGDDLLVEQHLGDGRRTAGGPAAQRLVDVDASRRAGPVPGDRSRVCSSRVRDHVEHPAGDARPRSTARVARTARTCGERAAACGEPVAATRQ